MEKVGEVCTASYIALLTLKQDPMAHILQKVFYVALLGKRSINSVFTVAGSDPNNSISGCSDFDVRLVGGNSNYTGMVEACYSTDTNSSLWGPICVSGSNPWTLTHARIVCAQLGFSPSGNNSVIYQ